MSLAGFGDQTGENTAFQIDADIMADFLIQNECIRTTVPVPFQQAGADEVLSVIDELFSEMTELEELVLCRSTLPYADMHSPAA